MQNLGLCSVLRALGSLYYVTSAVTRDLGFEVSSTGYKGKRCPLGLRQGRVDRGNKFPQTTYHRETRNLKREGVIRLSVKASSF